jgi:putative membrane protein
MLPPWLIVWLIYALAFWLTAAIVPGFKVDGFAGAVVAAGIFGVLNWLLGRFLFVLLGFATLGIGFILAFLTRWIVNAIVLKLAAAVSARLQIRSFAVAFVAGLLITFLAELGKRWLLHAPMGGGGTILV